MAKLTLEERIAKTQEAIRKEEAIIAQSREKLRGLQSTLKTLEKEKDQIFAQEIISTVSEGAALTNDQRSELLSLLKSFKLNGTPETEAAADSANPADPQEPAV
ncbi:MAG: hypothetical protein IKQ91_01640 [Oscillospiraceae bacterium]|nr:hypothetical protein [Oscillospiraceae bacterium]MBR3448421.1 hypothetical protein [Oscillospiraceae bacterium]MBR4199964.1 hypothetical protein [Oscillospiraceae bacterium]